MSEPVEFVRRNIVEALRNETKEKCGHAKLNQVVSTNKTPKMEENKNVMLPPPPITAVKLPPPTKPDLKKLPQPVIISTQSLSQFPPPPPLAAAPKKLPTTKLPAPSDKKPQTVNYLQLTYNSDGVTSIKTLQPVTKLLIPQLTPLKSPQIQMPTLLQIQPSAPSSSALSSLRPILPKPSPPGFLEPPVLRIMEVPSKNNEPLFPPSNSPSMTEIAEGNHIKCCYCQDGVFSSSSNLSRHQAHLHSEQFYLSSKLPHVPLSIFKKDLELLVNTLVAFSSIPQKDKPLAKETFKCIYCSKIAGVINGWTRFYAHLIIAHREVLSKKLGILQEKKYGLQGKLEVAVSVSKKAVKRSESYLHSWMKQRRLALAQVDATRGRGTGGGGAMTKDKLCSYRRVHLNKQAVDKHGGKGGKPKCRSMGDPAPSTSSSSSANESLSAEETDKMEYDQVFTNVAGEDMTEEEKGGDKEGEEEGVNAYLEVQMGQEEDSQEKGPQEYNNGNGDSYYNTQDDSSEEETSPEDEEEEDESLQMWVTSDLLE